uniref:Uncharacterized protein n=1 Tax=Oryza meridionalis TaxID=40149 RepID=A0A0E0F5E7_9ORYZ
MRSGKSRSGGDTVPRSQKEGPQIGRRPSPASAPPPAPQEQPQQQRQRPLPSSSASAAAPDPRISTTIGPAPPQPLDPSLSWLSAPAISSGRWWCSWQWLPHRCEWSCLVATIVSLTLRSSDYYLQQQQLQAPDFKSGDHARQGTKAARPECIRWQKQGS